MTYEELLTKQAYLKQKPISATIELLPLCNMNCDMCYVRLSHDELNKEGKLLTYQQWIEISKDMQQYGILFILITGGEPLLYPHFKELYIELKKMGFIISLNTNGTLLNEQWVNFFLQYKPRRINITLYGSNNDTYSSLCHYPNGFTYTINAIKSLIQNQLPVKINGSIVQENLDELEDLYNICNEYNVPIHVDTYMIPKITNNLINQGSIRLSPQDMAQAEITMLKYELTKDAFEEYVKTTISKLEQKNTHPKGISCQAGNTSFAINWKGLMLPCISMKGITIDVLKHGIEESWNYITAKSKELVLDNKCTTCPYRAICKTCVASAYLETNHYNQAPKYLCEYSKEFVKLLYKENNHLQ